MGSKTREEEKEVVEATSRNALVFSVPESGTSREDVSEEFYELTSEEAKEIYSGLKRAREQLDEKPLLTKALRQQGQEETLKRMVEKYPFTVVRIQFPNLMVLQGVFESLEKVRNVMDFVADHLHDPSVPFHLYTAPPKVILDPAKQLTAVNCVPAAKVYFGIRGETSKDGNYLKESVVGNMTDYETANKAALLVRRNPVAVTKDSREDKSAGPSDLRKSCESGSSESSSRPSQIRKTPKEKVPKWFKRQ